MYALLKMEWIGADEAQRMRAWERVVEETAPQHARFFSTRSERPWVARIWGRDSRFGYRREFIESQTDYAVSNGNGSRGVELCYFLLPGWYEVQERVSWSRWRRYFVRAEAGQLVEATREELDAWLSKSAP
jgi:hypothetical protein